jgi:bla regulator protein blaR1
MRRVFLIVVCLFLSMRVGAIAQIRPEFETASIKPAAPDERATVIAMPPGGRLEIMNMTLKAMIENAYSIQPFQISGGPGWLDSDHYDISAKAGIALKREEVLLRLQSLLADRFRVVVRREVKQLPVYALVMARKDGKPGPRLIESKKGGCTEPDPANPFAVDQRRLCGNFELGPEGVTLVSAPIATLTPLLSRVLGRTVLDKTGLTKNFDISIEWTPDEAIAMRPPPNGGPPDSAGPSIFTVFREQLGLKFQAQKGPVEIFQIEGAQKPSGN